MTRDLFRRYVWLVETVKNRGKITFDEISKTWDKSSFNIDHSKLALRTFHNHREAIELLFGIRIMCDRSTHQYYIPDDAAESTNLKLWMLQSLSLDPLVKIEGKDLEQRMIVDETPSHKFGILTIIEAMKRNRTLRFKYPTDNESGVAEVELEPYSLRYYENTWYVFGKDIARNKLKLFRLPAVTHFEITERKFKLPQDFCASEFFRKYAGIEPENAMPEERIMLKVKGAPREIMRVKPLHPSQTELKSEPDFSLFEIVASPTSDFVGKLLMLGDKVEVMAPVALRNLMRDKIQSLANLYAD